MGTEPEPDQRGDALLGLSLAQPFGGAYERRGATFSDSVLLDRKTLLERLKGKKRFVTGSRRALWAGTFATGPDVTLVTRDGREFVSTRADAAEDTLEGVPVI